MFDFEVTPKFGGIFMFNLSKQDKIEIYHLLHN